MNTKSFTAGFVVGGIAAGIAALLSSPASGSIPKSYIKENMKLLRENFQTLRESLNNLVETVTILSKEGKETLPSFIADVKSLIADWKQNVQPHQELLNKEINSIQVTIQELENRINSHKL